jgi:hypothetical protein
VYLYHELCRRKHEKRTWTCSIISVLCYLQGHKIFGITKYNLEWLKQVFFCFVEVLKIVTMKSVVFWVLTPRSSMKFRRFGGTYPSTSSGSKLCEAGNQQKQTADRSWLFDPEDEGDIFLRNVGLYPNYTSLQPRRKSFSRIFPPFLNRLCDSVEPSVVAR